MVACGGCLRCVWYFNTSNSCWCLLDKFLHLLILTPPGSRLASAAFSKPMDRMVRQEALTKLNSGVLPLQKFMFTGPNRSTTYSLACHRRPGECLAGRFSAEPLISSHLKIQCLQSILSLCRSWLLCIIPSEQLLACIMLVHLCTGSNVCSSTYTQPMVVPVAYMLLWIMTPALLR